MNDKLKSHLKKLCRVLRSILIFTLILGAILFGLRLLGSYTLYSKYSIDYKANAQLKYYYYKDLLVDEVQKYIDECSHSQSNLTALSLVDACNEYSVDIIFVLAQGNIESKFGTKGLARSTNSVWNHGAFDGKKFDQLMGWCKYSHPDLSIRPYLKNLRENYLVDKCEEDLMENFVNINGLRYASSTTYEESLTRIYNDIKSSTGIDSLYRSMEYWSIRSGH